jgi:hypothetical protein
MEIDFKEREWEVLNLIYLASAKEMWWALMKTVMKLWIL